jgi:hypothetical protein
MSTLHVYGPMQLMEAFCLGSFVCIIFTNDLWTCDRCALWEIKKCDVFTEPSTLLSCSILPSSFIFLFQLPKPEQGFLHSNVVFVKFSLHV